MRKGGEGGEGREGGSEGKGVINKLIKVLY